MQLAMWLGLLLVLSLYGTCWSRDFTFTVKLKSGTSECFYDYIHVGAFLEIEYQVWIAVATVVASYSV